MKVAGFRTQVFQFETDRPLADVNFPEGRKIWSRAAIFVDTDEGLTGTSITSPAACQMIEAIEPIVLGKDPRGVRGIWKTMVDYVFKGGNRGVASEAISGIDLALWDLKAKANNEPLWQTLGAATPRVKAYGSDIGLCLSDDELRRFYEDLASKGVSAGKLKVGLDQEMDIRRIGIMRDALAQTGERPTLAVDSNEYWSPKQAIRKIREMEEHFDLMWVEEPAGRWDYRGLRRVSRSVAAAVASGENLKDISEFMPLLSNEAVDIVEVGMYTSGITGAMQVADFAYGFDLPVCMMNAPGNLMAHLAAALPNHMMMEVVNAGHDACFSVDTDIVDGWIRIGDTPGLGLVFDEEKLAELSAASPAQHGRITPGRGEGAGLYGSQP